jgi:hypothetical protein
MNTFRNHFPTFTFLFSAFILLALGSCEEEPPFISLTDDAKPLTDTNYITSTIPPAQEKKVLIEDISGVNCVNCPAAADKAEAILLAKGSKVTVVTLMPDKSLLPQFTDPKNIFTPLTNNKANQLLNFITPPNGLPAGMINRGDFGNGRTMAWQFWDGPVDTELAKPNNVNIELETDYDATKNTVLVSIRVTYVEDQTDSLQNISLMITETDIKGVQKDLSGTNTDYTFKHIMRDFATNALGDPIKATLVKGRVIERQYLINMDPSWVAANCEIVGLVHSRQGKVVYQSVHKKVL